jgi:CHAT domain-containing protein
MDGEAAARLRAIVWEPLEPLLRGASTLLISPDGLLSSFPFAALPGREPGTYLIEERGVVVIPVPEYLPELLRGPRPGIPAAGDPPSLLLAGAIDYGAAPKAEVLAMNDSQSFRRRAGLYRNWPPLDGTRGEVNDISDSFERTFHRRATLLRFGEATESAVGEEAPKHRFLHLATHGYFAPPELKSWLESPAISGTEALSRVDISAFHPGLLSGLILAGANSRVDLSGDDGVLTALEVAEMSLDKVDLVTLSACETGLGQSAGGEGILGLQRAFQTAGARSVVATLWKIPDLPSRTLMTDFYEDLWVKKKTRLEALRAAQLRMLNEGATRGVVRVELEGDKRRRVPPSYWAGFILSGEWR